MEADLCLIEPDEREVSCEMHGEMESHQLVVKKDGELWVPKQDNNVYVCKECLASLTQELGLTDVNMEEVFGAFIQTYWDGVERFMTTIDENEDF